MDSNTSLASNYNNVTFEDLRTRLANDFVEIERLVSGRILTILDTLILSPSQEKAIKDLIKSSVRQSLSEVGSDYEYLFEKVAKDGVQPAKDGAVPIDLSLTNYRRISTNVERELPAQR